MAKVSVQKVLDIRPDAELCGDTPVMKIIDALDKMSISDVLEVIYDEDDHGEDILLWMKKTKQKLVRLESAGDPKRILIEKTK